VRELLIQQIEQRKLSVWR